MNQAKTDAGVDAWWSNPENLAELWEWLEANGEEPTDGPAYFMRKPWKWEPEWRQMRDIKGGAL